MIPRGEAKVKRSSPFQVFFISSGRLKACFRQPYKIKNPDDTVGTASALLAEREGFEPPVVLPTTVFKTAAIDRSAISPGAKVQNFDSPKHLHSFFSQTSRQISISACFFVSWRPEIKRFSIMKTLLYIPFLLLTLLCSKGYSRNAQAFFAYNVFYAPEKGPYIETYLSVVGKSLVYAKKPNGRYQGSVEVTITLRQDSSIKYFDKYNLQSQETDDTLNVLNFIDQQRIPLANGKYTMDLTIADNNNRENLFSSSNEVFISFSHDRAQFSDIELVESFQKTEKIGILTKSGYDVIPYVNNYYPPEINSLRFYTELYNTSRVTGTSGFLIRYYLVQQENKKILPDYGKFIKQESREVNVVMGELPIEQLESGNYILVVEARDRNNELLAKNEVFFQRNNPGRLSDDSLNAGLSLNGTFVQNMNKRDSLAENIRSLRPLANEMERDFIDHQTAHADLETLKRFMYSFWKKRAPGDPGRAWTLYHAEVLAVNAAYGTRIIKGYNTDRGRVYLQYGRPNTITANHNENNAYPYEIWHYYKLKTQSNRKFVFYNPDLVTNDFQLIHSDANGEIFDKQWQYKIHQRNKPFPRDHDVEKVGDRKLDDAFELPR
jgi:GWxTD domain-containing protein